MDDEMNGMRKAKTITLETQTTDLQGLVQTTTEMIVLVLINADKTIIADSTHHKATAPT